MKLILKRVVCISLPLMLSNIAIPLLGLVDSAILGHLDDSTYLAAAALGASLISLVIASFNFLRMTSTGLSALAFGANKQELQAQVFQQGLLLGLFIGLLISLSSVWIVSFGLHWMLPTEQSDLYALAKEYCQIRLLAAPASLGLYAIIGWAIGQQNTHLALLCLLGSCVINLVLDYIFIIEWHWQSAGSAWASVIAEYSSLVMAIFYCQKNYPFLAQRFYAASVNKTSLTKLLNMNSDLFIRSSCLLLVFAFFNTQSAHLGSLTLAANAILLQCIMMQSYLLDGLAHAAEALVGESKGRKDRHRGHLYRIISSCTLIVAIVLTLIFFSLNDHLAPLFTQQPRLIEQLDNYLIWVIIFPLISCWAYLLDGIAVGLSESRAMRNSIVIATIVIFLPTWLLSQSFGNHGLWLSFFVFFVARGLLLLPILKS